MRVLLATFARTTILTDSKIFMSLIILKLNFPIFYFYSRIAILAHVVGGSGAVLNSPVTQHAVPLVLYTTGHSMESLSHSMGTAPTSW